MKCYKKKEGAGGAMELAAALTNQFIATDFTDSTETWHHHISGICAICGCFLDFADVFCLQVRV
jgi:hypothetical protein